VRESVPWAIDEDEYDFACLTSYLKQSVMVGPCPRLCEP
jgi:hypothetical protein